MKTHISELIKIAYEHDELRSDLVPLIQGELKVARRSRSRVRGESRQRAEEGATRLRQQEGDYSSEGNVWSDISQPSDTDSEDTLTIPITEEQGGYSDQEVEEILSDFEFVGYIKREHFGEKWIHPETKLPNTINTIIEKARDGDEHAINIILEMHQNYEYFNEDDDEPSSEDLEGIREAFNDLDLTDFNNNVGVQGFCSIVGKSMSQGSWTGRKTLIGELVDDTLWSIDASYSPIIRAVKELGKSIDKNNDGKIEAIEVVDYVRLAAEEGLDLDLGDITASGVSASLLKNALEEVLISAIMAKMTFAKGLSGGVAKRVVGKVVTHMLGAVLDKSGVDDMVSKATKSAMDFVAEKADVASEKMNAGKVGSALQRRAEAAALVPSKINAKYKKEVQALADSLGNTPSARELEEVANKVMKLAEKYFAEGSADIENAIKDSLVFRGGQAVTPAALKKLMKKLGSESSIDSYVEERLQNKGNHTGFVLSYLEQQLRTLQAEQHISDNMGSLSEEIYKEFMGKFSNKEERDKILDMVKYKEL